ncbi:MAG: hypothetical protein ABEI57_00560 [Halapricum sp.]
MALSSDVVVGVFCVLVGAGVFRYARPFTDFTEQFDAIGSTNDIFETEAADWKVTIVRFLGGGLAILGVIFVLSGLTG